MALQQSRIRYVLRTSAAMIMAACLIAGTGCGSKDAPPTPPGQKPTAAQNAAMQRAIEQGPAIHAANAAQTGTK